VISDQRPQFVVELFKEIDRILGIETKLLAVFHSQIDRQTKCMNQELEQYLRFFVDYRQNNWLELLAIANYERELRTEADIRGK